jgi:hypothetical protein
MIETQTLQGDVQRSLHRILPRREEILKLQIRRVRLSWEQFSSRLHRNFSVLLMLSLHTAQMQHSNKDHYHEK